MYSPIYMTSYGALITIKRRAYQKAYGYVQRFCRSTLHTKIIATILTQIQSKHFRKNNIKMIET